MEIDVFRTMQPEAKLDWLLGEIKFLVAQYSSLRRDLNDLHKALSITAPEARERASRPRKKTIRKQPGTTRNKTSTGAGKSQD